MDTRLSTVISHEGYCGLYRCTCETHGFRPLACKVMYTHSTHTSTHIFTQRTRERTPAPILRRFSIPSDAEGSFSMCTYYISRSRELSRVIISPLASRLSPLAARTETIFRNVAVSDVYAAGNYAIVRRRALERSKDAISRF